jgi:outer membrane protein assembly factor BamB
VIFLAGVVFESAVASPADWPMYRNNPLHTGVAADTLPPPLALKWKQTFGGAVHSSPAVVGSRLYVGSGDGNLYAIDTATGNIIWTFNDPVAGVGTTLAWDSSPAVATISGRTVIFAGNDNFKFYAVRDDGTTPFKLWDTAALAIGVAVKSSPALANVAGTDIVIFGTEGAGVYALVASTGALYPGWVLDPILGGLTFDSPAIFGSTFFIGSTAGNLYGINVATGTQLFLPQALGGPVRSSPAVANVVVANVPTDLVFVGSQTSNQMNARVAATGAFQWTFPTGGAVSSSPAVASIPNPPGPCAPGPTLAVIFGSADGNVYAVRASDAKLCWTFPSTGLVPFDSSPTVSGQTVYIGSADDNMYAIDINTGLWQWSFPATSPIGSNVVAPNPVVSGSTLYFGTNGPENRLYAFQPAVPVVTTTSTNIVSTSTSTTVPVTQTSTLATSTVTTGITQTQTSMTATTQTQTATSTSITTTQTQTATISSTTSTTTTVPSQGIPGFPVESILIGLAGGLVLLTLLGRRRRRQ